MRVGRHKQHARDKHRDLSMPKSEVDLAKECEIQRIADGNCRKQRGPKNRSHLATLMRCLQANQTDRQLADRDPEVE